LTESFEQSHPRELAVLASQTRLLKRLAEGLSGGLDMRRVATTVVDTVMSEMGAENCSLYLLDSAGDAMTLTVARGRLDDSASFHKDGGGFKKFAVGEGVSGTVAATGEPILIDDVRKDGRFVDLTPFASEIRSLLSVPLKAQDEVVAVMNLSHHEPGAFSRENEDLISTVSAQAGIALANVRLYTSLAEANEQLALSERRFRELFTRANDAFLLIDETGHIVEANRRWADFAGVGQSEWETLEFESPQGETLSLREFLRRRAFVSEGTRIEAALVRPDGPTSMVEISSKAFPVQRERLCLVSVADVTERRRLAEQLIKSERLAAVGEITAALAHEVNNPLGALYNAVCLLKSDLALSGDNERLMQVAVEEAAHLSEIVNDFLSFARFPQARLDWYDINELVSAMLFLMKRDERMGPHIEVATELSENVAACRIDRGQFQEVLFNLVSNALDAMTGGGTLTIRTYNATLADKPAVGLLVEDTGVGMEPADVEKVFAPFYTTKQTGTGLGLSIVKRILDDHHGSISVDSKPGQGSRFSVVLPVSREEALWLQS
jgi:PAS domain S-box-containing protein